MKELRFFVFQIDEERNATDWWDAGGREIWDEAQVRAGNANRRCDLSCPLAVPVPDPFDIFARFSDTPSWIDTEPLIVTEIKAATKEEAAGRMLDLGVTRANLRALDLAEDEGEDEEEAVDRMLETGVTERDLADGEEEETAAGTTPEEFGSAMETLMKDYHMRGKGEKNKICGVVFFDKETKEPFILILGPAEEVIERGCEMAKRCTIQTLGGMMLSEYGEKDA